MKIGLTEHLIRSCLSPDRNSHFTRGPFFFFFVCVRHCKPDCVFCTPTFCQACSRCRNSGWRSHKTRINTEDSGIITLRFQQQTCPFDASTLYVREITEYHGLNYCTVSSDHPGTLIIKVNSALNVICFSLCMIHDLPLHIVKRISIYCSNTKINLAQP